MTSERTADDLLYASVFRRAEMRWASMEDAKITIGARVLAEIGRDYAAAVARNQQLQEALERAREEINGQWCQMLDNADRDDGSGAHVGFARHARAVADGLGRADRILSAALASVRARSET